MTKLTDYAEQLPDDELRQLVASLRMDPSFAWLTKELKDEWRACEEYAKKRRSFNWDNRKVSGAQGMSKDGVRQERMKLPRLAEMQIEKEFGLEWSKEKKAQDWAWNKFPQFRLIEKR